MLLCEYVDINEYVCIKLKFHFLNSKEKKKKKEKIFINSLHSRIGKYYISYLLYTYICIISKGDTYVFRYLQFDL